MLNNIFPSQLIYENKVKKQSYKEIQILLCEVNIIVILEEKFSKTHPGRKPSCIAGFTGEMEDIPELVLN